MQHTMKAVVTTGHGGFERLEYRDVPRPQPQAGEVLIQVLAAGINNTDINTRVGWYGAGRSEEDEKNGWNGATPFPLIQGADCCGRIAELGADASDNGRLQTGQRVLVRSCMRTRGFDQPETRWLGTDFDGAFAGFVKVPATEVFPVNSDWSDAALATLPCAYGTAENMLQRAGVRATDHVVVTGASGGVGSAAVQLALRRGAQVSAITTADKVDAVRQLGAHRVLLRHEDPTQQPGAGPVSVIVDNVAGPGTAQRVQWLARGGRYVTSGAIAGAHVELDWRVLYLNDLTLLGSTAWDAPVFPDLICYVERNEIRPLLAATYPLSGIAEAQAAFLRREHVGNLVLLP